MGGRGVLSELCVLQVYKIVAFRYSVAAFVGIVFFGHACLHWVPLCFEFHGLFVLCELLAGALLRKVFCP